MKRSSARGTYEKLLKISKDNKTEPVLDCPAGEGMFSAMLVEAGFSDVKAAEYDVAKFKPKDIAITPCDLNKQLSFKTESFASIFCIDGLCEVDDVPNALREFCRILKTNGTIYISTANVLNLRSRLRYLLTGFYSKYKLPFDEQNGQSTHRILPYWELRYLLVRNGFSSIEIFTNRYKFSDVIFGIALYPFVLLALPFVFSSRKARERSRVIFSMLSPKILFGESLLIRTLKKPER